MPVESLDSTARGEGGFGSTGSSDIIKLKVSAISAMANSDLLIFPGILEGRHIKILIDGGSQGNFVST